MLEVKVGQGFFFSYSIFAEFTGIMISQCFGALIIDFECMDRASEHILLCSVPQLWAAVWVCPTRPSRSPRSRVKLTSSVVPGGCWNATVDNPPDNQSKHELQPSQLVRESQSFKNKSATHTTASRFIVGEPYHLLSPFHNRLGIRVPLRRVFEHAIKQTKASSFKPSSPVALCRKSHISSFWKQKRWAKLTQMSSWHLYHLFCVIKTDIATALTKSWIRTYLNYKKTPNYTRRGFWGRRVGEKMNVAENMKDR